MKNFKENSRFWNRAIANPTQNMYFRFVKGFRSPLESQFTKAKADFDRPWSEKIKSIYWNEGESQ